MRDLRPLDLGGRWSIHRVRAWAISSCGLLPAAGSQHLESCDYASQGGAGGGAYGVPVLVDTFHLWVQQGAFLSRKWDLACWGADGIPLPTITGAQISAFSWSTMSQCARRGIDIDEDSPRTVEVSAGPARPPA
jgi:hypothetical protein